MQSPRVSLFTTIAWLTAGWPMSHAAGQGTAPSTTNPTPETTELVKQVQIVRANLPNIADRGAVLYFLAAANQHLGNSREARSLLSECLALEEGFDPTSSSTLRSLVKSKDLGARIRALHARYPMRGSASQAFVMKQRDLVTEGLAYSVTRRQFYLSSLNRRTIIAIGAVAGQSEFVRNPRDLLPILGIHSSPIDDTVWAASWRESSGSSELLHFDGEGNLLGRYHPQGSEKHGFNDLVVKRNGEVIVTDSIANAVYRFSPADQSFSPLPTHRPLFYPNGITLGASEDQLYIADLFGILLLHAQGVISREVMAGPRNTMAGVDGLYWHKGRLIAVQNELGLARLVAFRLSPDAWHVSNTTVLESRKQYVEGPSTGAIVGDDFYFIVNSQLDNMTGDEVSEQSRLAPVRIGVLRLP